jgi:sugar phosphate isomerase/epimerase
MSRLGIEMQSVFGMPPLEHVKLAASLGCPHISIGLLPMPWNPCDFAPWSLRDDTALRREMIATMRDRNVQITLAEGFSVRANVEAADRRDDLDRAMELGAQRISAVCMERDQARALDQLATLADLAAQRGMGFVLEFAPPHAVNDLHTAIAALRAIDRPNAQLVIDTMHLFRSGSSVADIAAVDPGLIGYVQLADVPLLSGYTEYLQEASFERRIPGEGELPLLDLLRALPRGLPVGLEIPMQTEARAGRLESALGRAAKASRELLQRVDDPAPRDSIKK